MGNFVKNSALYLISTLVLKATSFLLLPLYTNLIPPDVYGQVYIINSIITFLSLFLTLSLNSSLQRYFFNCRNEEEVKVLYSTLVIFVLLISAGVVAVLYFFNDIIASWLDIPSLYTLLAYCTIFLSLFYNMIIALLYVKQDAVRISIASIVIGVVQIVSQVILVINMDDKGLAMVLSLLIGGILQFAVFLLFSRPYFIMRFDSNQLRPCLKYGLSQFPSDISNWIVSFFDRIILNKYQDSAAVGIYGMGHTLATVPQMLYHSMNKALSPKVFEDFKRYEDKLVSDLTYAVSLIERVFVFITIVLSLLVAFANNIITLLSSQYASSALVMFLVLFACLIDIYRMLFMFPLAYNVKYVKVKSFIWVLASIASILLNLWLIPKYSYLGACITLITVNTIALLFIIHFADKAMPVKYSTSKLITVFILSVVYGCTYFLGTGWFSFALKIVGAIVYVKLILCVYPIDLKAIILSLKK